MWNSNPRKLDHLHDLGAVRRNRQEIPWQYYGLYNNDRFKEYKFKIIRFVVDIYMLCIHFKLFDKCGVYSFSRMTKLMIQSR